MGRSCIRVKESLKPQSNRIYNNIGWIIYLSFLIKLYNRHDTHLRICRVTQDVGLLLVSFVWKPPQIRVCVCVSLTDRHKPRRIVILGQRPQNYPFIWEKKPPCTRHGWYIFLRFINICIGIFEFKFVLYLYLKIIICQFLVTVLIGLQSSLGLTCVWDGLGSSYAIIFCAASRYLLASLKSNRSWIFPMSRYWHLCHMMSYGIELDSLGLSVTLGFIIYRKYRWNLYLLILFFFVLEGT